MTGSSLGPQTLVARKGDLPATAVDDDLVILNLATQNYVGLDDIGRVIWEELSEPRRVDDLCRAMTERSTGPTDAIHADVEAFLGEMLSEGLIVIVEA